MFTKPGECVAPVITPIEEITVNINNKEVSIVKAEKDEVGGEIKLYEYVYPHKLRNQTFDFSHAKNSLIERATRKWIFNIDADERLMIEEDELATIANLPDNVGACRVGIVSYTLPDKNGVDIVRPSQHLRIFRNDKRIRFKYKVHEDISQAVANNGFKVFPSTIIIKHRGYEGHNPQDLKDKTYRNLRLICAELTENPKDKYMLGYLKKSVDVLSKVGDI
jgi:glycosyltransferase involved in cell wall biosynthesis